MRRNPTPSGRKVVVADLVEDFKKFSFACHCHRRSSCEIGSGINTGSHRRSSCESPKAHASHASPHTPAPSLLDGHVTRFAQ